MRHFYGVKGTGPLAGGSEGGAEPPLSFLYCTQSKRAIKQISLDPLRVGAICTPVHSVCLPRQS